MGLWGVSERRAGAGHLLGPLFIRSLNPRFLHGPCLVGGYGPAPFRLGICTGPFPVGNMDRPLSGWEYGPAPFRLGIWTGRVKAGLMSLCHSTERKMKL